VTTVDTEYDALGRAVKVTDAKGLVTETTHEATPNGGFPRNTQVTFYNTAATADPLWNFTPPSGAIQKHNELATGTFDTASGDFFGDGYDDVYWFGSTTSVIWDWAGGVNPVVRGFGV
jgi:hypothetical protein